MKDNLVDIVLHGDLGKYMVNRKWNLAVNSVSTAISAINCLTNNKFSDYFIQNNKLYAKYRILINGKDFISPVKEINENNWEEINNSELIIKNDNIKTIDIVPILEGNNSKGLGIGALILGIILIIVGIILISTPFGAPLIIGGLGLVAAGVISLLTKSPKFQNFRNIDKADNESYLFGGPINIIGEGGPVPVGYGTVLIGSQVISSSYKVQDYQTFVDNTTSP